MPRAAARATPKAQAETALEDAAFILARALANHFKKTNNLEKLAQVDVTKSEIVQLRQQDLLDKTTAIRDLATATVRRTRRRRTRRDAPPASPR